MSPDRPAPADDVDEVDPTAGDDEVAEEPTADPEPARRPGFILAVSLAVVFALAAAALGLVLASRDDGDPRIDEVRASAGEFGAALVTYDFREPEVHRDRVLELATGSFRTEYEEAFDRGLSEIITEVEAVSQGFVDEVYVSALDEERAQAIVVVDIEHEGAGGPRSLLDVYFLLALVEVDGSWKVDQVTDLNFDTSGAGGASDPGTGPIAPESTTTSVP
jgi:Mce-associated membrane protein